MKKRLLYNVGRNKVDHLQKNIEMFRGLGLECEEFMYFPFRLIGSKWDFIYLNWYENIFQGSFIVAYSQYFVKKIALWYMKLRKMTIITSQHNKVQHGKKYSRMSNDLFKTIYKQSSKIVVFSNEGKKDLQLFLSENEINEKAVYIPPVNYIGTYPYVEHEWIAKLRSNDYFNVLFIGNMGYPYKNVPMVIDLANKLSDINIKFIFAGKAGDAATKASYLDRIGNAANVVAEFRYINDDEMAHLLEIGDIVIIPYDTESMSNSGTARLAFSYAKSVICPRIASLESIPDELIYTYTYQEASEHSVKLEERVLDAYNDYINRRDEFDNKGKRLKQIMVENNSEEVLLEKYRKIFKDTVS